MLDVVIVGSGPAGLAAAIYAKRAGFSTLVIEKAPMSGGQIINTSEVDNYPGLPGISGFDMGMKFREHAEAMGAEFAEGEAEAVRDLGAYKEIVLPDKVYQARAVILAAGATHSKLGVPGEEELLGKGVSYCATCDGAFFRGRTAAVIGGGDVAAEDAVFLARFCKKVYVIHRRDWLRAADSLQKKLFSFSNVEVIWDSTVEKIEGTDQVAGILTVNKKTGEKQTIAADGAFIAVGIRPETDKFADLLQLDKGGYIVAGEDCRTNIEGIFAAGDIRTKPLRQVVTAVADGANAVTGVQEYFLQNTKSLKN